MSEIDRLRAENGTLRLRLARLTEEILRISENFDLETVLQEDAYSARALTDARYGAITTIADQHSLKIMPMASEITGPSDCAAWPRRQSIPAIDKTNT
ncbi:MAG: hypothetical protein OXG11_02930 [Chloroflexi bacterium]|nr:hypothetical protein [Chloroflexota bacterium]